VNKGLTCKCVISAKVQFNFQWCQLQMESLWG
jgi:hypothetical protein